MVIASRAIRLRPTAAGLALFLQFLAFAACLFGIKLWLIHSYGNATPYWDQWDAEAAFLYEPHLQGRLPWEALVGPHNEHRIFTTRLLGLLLLHANGLWNPLLQMIVNAAVHIAAISVAVGLLVRSVATATDTTATTQTSTIAPTMLAFALAVFGVPYAWENTLAGFQTQFYLVLLFSVLGIWLLMSHSAFTRGWWGGIAVAAAAYFSFASGVFVLAAVTATYLLRCVVVSRSARELWAALVVMALFVAGVLGTPVIEMHASLKATNASQFFGALGRTLAWPSLSAKPSQQWSMALMRNLPWAVLVLVVLWRRMPRSSPLWFLVALGIWITGQAVSVAYGRAADVLTSRYLDLHSMALLINFAALMVLGRIAAGRLRTLWGIGSAAWLVLMFCAVFHLLEERIPAGLDSKQKSSALQESTLKAYLLTGDRAALMRAPASQLAYPSADRLATIVDSPTVRQILPKNLQPVLKPVRESGAIEGKADGFVPGGAFPGTTSCGCEFIGSYGPAGDGGRGEVRLRYEPQGALTSGRNIEIKVAGYPSKAGGIEIVQDGVARRVRVGRDPGEKWVNVYVPIALRPFEIHLVDQSPGTWLAVSDPVLVGRLDPVVNRLLNGWSDVLAIGAAALCLLLMFLMAPIWRRPRSTPEQRRTPDIPAR